MICASAFGQTPAARPEFEVASIKPSAPMGTAKVLANIFGDAASGSFAVLEFSPEDFRAVGIRAAIAAGVALPPQVVQMAESASQDSLFNAIRNWD